MNTYKKIQKIVETFMIEDDEEQEYTEDDKVIKIFYSDLSLEGKQKVLEAIDASYEYVDVFEDDVVRENIEEGLSKKPIIIQSAEELINKMDFNI